MPLPGCLLHSGTPFPMSSPICAIVFPLILLSQHLCSLFSPCLCSLLSLSLLRKNNFLYCNTVLYFFFYFFVAVNLVSFSMTFSHYSFHLPSSPGPLLMFLLILQLSNPSPSFFHIRILLLYKAYNLCLEWDYQFDPMCYKFGVYG